MRHFFFGVFMFFGFLVQVHGQKPEYYTNATFLKNLYSDSSYLNLKNKTVQKYNHTKPGRWGEFVSGVCEDLNTNQKVIALTFDACGGEKGAGFDRELVDYLRKEKIPATLFITGRWIDSHFSEFMNLSRDPLFEIENHGLNHRPCSVCGESKYGIRGTANASEAFDEMEANARKINALTGHRPVFFRSSTAFIDEACARLAHDLGITPISYQVLSGDAGPNIPKQTIKSNVLKNIRPGAIVIMHMNHPQWNTCEALRDMVPELRKMGYRFARLDEYKTSYGRKK
jgi:peptidoglycan/xylan/chitin deacetylase (PgdA/CDA1 family)